MKYDGLDFTSQRKSLVARLVAEGVLRSPKVIRAMETVPREEFLPPDKKAAAYYDTPLSIGFGQTISAPHMVAMMCEALELVEGQKVLEVGAGSGYHAAVIAEIVAPFGAERAGRVYSVEIHKSLVEFARENLERVGYGGRVFVVEGDGSQGLPQEAPFDRISVTASAPSIPKPLIDQLKPGGVMVIPVGSPYSFQELLWARKGMDGRLDIRGICGVAFVPLTGKYGWKG
ncbi:MAG: protein-L-isoaspartate(D-aspartate) O-methyltransferase [Candidatus Bathyarchaeia archaeon]